MYGQSDDLMEMMAEMMMAGGLGDDGEDEYDDDYYDNGLEEEDVFNLFAGGKSRQQKTPKWDGPQIVEIDSEEEAEMKKEKAEAQERKTCADARGGCYGQRPRPKRLGGEGKHRSSHNCQPYQVDNLRAMAHPFACVHGYQLKYPAHDLPVNGYLQGTICRVTNNNRGVIISLSAWQPMGKDQNDSGNTNAENTIGLYSCATRPVDALTPASVGSVVCIPTCCLVLPGRPPALSDQPELQAVDLVVLVRNWELASFKTAEQLATLKEEGNTYFRKGEYIDAANTYSMMLKHQLTTPVLSNRAACLLQLGLPILSLVDSVFASMLEPSWAKSYFRIGMGLSQAGHWSESTTAFEKCLGDLPANTDKTAIQIEKQKVEQQGGGWEPPTYSITKHSFRCTTEDIESVLTEFVSTPSWIGSEKERRSILREKTKAVLTSDHDEECGLIISPYVPVLLPCYKPIQVNNVVVQGMCVHPRNSEHRARTVIFDPQSMEYGHNTSLLYWEVKICSTARTPLSAWMATPPENITACMGWTHLGTLHGGGYAGLIQGTRSMGFHFDDGCVWMEGRQHWLIAPPTVGDVIGCGIDLELGVIFVTLNGKWVGVVQAVDDLLGNTPSVDALYPVLTFIDCAGIYLEVTCCGMDCLFNVTEMLKANDENRDLNIYYDLNLHRDVVADPTPKQCTLQVLDQPMVYFQLVFSYLNIYTVLQCQAVSKSWHMLINNKKSSILQYISIPTTLNMYALRCREFERILSKHPETLDIRDISINMMNIVGDQDKFIWAPYNSVKKLYLASEHTGLCVFQPLIQLFPKLEELYVQDADEIDSDHLQLIAKCCKNLKCLGLVGDENYGLTLTEQEVTEFLQAASPLTDLLFGYSSKKTMKPQSGIDGCDCNIISVLSTSKHNTTLRRLCLSALVGCETTETEEYTVLTPQRLIPGSLPGVQHLCLCMDSLYDNDLVCILAACPNVAVLGLSTLTNCSHKSYQTIPKYLKDLKTLHVTLCNKIDMSWLVEVFQKCSKLEEFLLSTEETSSAYTLSNTCTTTIPQSFTLTLQKIAANSCLRGFKCRHMAGIGSDMIKALSAFPNLEILSFRYCELKDAKKGGWDNVYNLFTKPSSFPRLKKFKVQLTTAELCATEQQHEPVSDNIVKKDRQVEHSTLNKIQLLRPLLNVSEGSDGLAWHAAESLPRPKPYNIQDVTPPFGFDGEVVCPTGGQSRQGDDSDDSGGWVDEDSSGEVPLANHMGGMPDLDQLAGMMAAMGLSGGDFMGGMDDDDDDEQWGDEDGDEPSLAELAAAMGGTDPADLLAFLSSKR